MTCSTSEPQPPLTNITAGCNRGPLCDLALTYKHTWITQDIILHLNCYYNQVNSTKNWTDGFKWILLCKWIQRVKGLSQQVFPRVMEELAFLNLNYKLGFHYEKMEALILWWHTARISVNCFFFFFFFLLDVQTSCVLTSACFLLTCPEFDG